MNYFYLVLFLISLSFPQSFLNRLIVPVYIDSEFSYGYDDNYLKLSIPEQDDNLDYRLGDSNRLNSNVIKNKINILYIPYIFRKHDTKFNFTIATSNYSSSNLKSYNYYYFKFSQHMAPYTWFKFNYSYIPSFYIKSYVQSDPYILYVFEQNNYMASFFNSEKLSFELSAPVPYMKKTYITMKYLFESQYYNADFIEFDLEIDSYYLKIRKKIFKYFNISIAYMKSKANNISYMNDLPSTFNKDRSYIQDRLYASFSMSKIHFFGREISAGFYSNIDYRDFSSIHKEDLLHFNRSHIDFSTSYWFKRHLSNYIDIKIKATNRARNTSSPYYVGNISIDELKTFKKFEIWLSVILKMELNVY